MPLLDAEEEQSIIAKLDTTKTPLWKYWTEFMELSLEY
jgi:hypothetical protein